MDQREAKKYKSREQFAENFERRFKGMLEGNINLESKSVEDQFYAEHHFYDNDALPGELKEDLENRLFSLKSKIVKACLDAHKKFITEITRNYQRELNYSKTDKYVLGLSPRWMMEDGKIVKNLERFTYTVPILNYLWNINRYTRGTELVQMIELTKQVANPIKHETGEGKKYDYATFVTNAEFYEKMISRIGCSKNYIQKYFIEFTQIGILKKLGNVGRDGTLYSDGYYVPYGDSFRKETFLKYSPEFREGLRSFDPLRSGA